MTSGIYVITNSINGHRYVGQSMDVERRLLRHRRQLEAGVSRHPILQAAANRYGPGRLQSRMLFALDADRDLLNLFEARAIAVLRPEYNCGLWPISDQTIETRHKISKSLLGNTRMLGHSHSEEARRKIGEANMGNKNVLGYRHSEEARSKISEAGKGRHCSKETRLKMAESRTRWWISHRIQLADQMEV